MSGVNCEISWAETLPEAPLPNAVYATSRRALGARKTLFVQALLDFFHEKPCNDSRMAQDQSS